MGRAGREVERLLLLLCICSQHTSQYISAPLCSKMSLIRSECNEELISLVYCILET